MKTPNWEPCKLDGLTPFLDIDECVLETFWIALFWRVYHIFASYFFLIHFEDYFVTNSKNAIYWSDTVNVSIRVVRFAGRRIFNFCKIVWEFTFNKRSWRSTDKSVAAPLQTGNISSEYGSQTRLRFVIEICRTKIPCDELAWVIT